MANWGPFYEKLILKESLTMPKKLKGDPLGFFNIYSVGKYQKIEGNPLVKKNRKSLTAENTRREYPLAPLSFLDDVKILLRKPSKNFKNFKIVRIVRNVTISAKRLTETRGGGARTVNMIRDLDLHGPSLFSLQGSQSQGGGTIL